MGTTTEDKNKVRRVIKNFKGDMDSQSIRISSGNVSNANKEKARNELIFLKSSINKIEENELKRAIISAQAHFLNEGQQYSNTGLLEKLN